MGLENLGDLVIHVIVSKLGAKNAAVVACVNRRFRVWASEETLWMRFCSQDLDLSLPQDPFGNPTPSFKETYKIWKESFGMYPIPLVRRAKRCWKTIKEWTALTFPEALSSLRRGASESELNEVENALGVKLPIPTRLLYRFCDGQEVPPSVSAQSDVAAAVGIIGGYSFYNYIVNVHLLPLKKVIMETRDYAQQLGFSDGSKYIVVAASTYMEKLFFLNCVDGQLHVGTAKLFSYEEMMQCVPRGLLKSTHDLNGDQQQDAMLLWLEEHGRRLQSGMIRVREEQNVRSISLFPEAPPLCTTAVTNGVQIRASAVFVPELCDLQDEKVYCFSYSIRMHLLPEGCMLDGVYFTSCQLYWRHWIIRAKDAVVSEVSDEAVIGKYPLLSPDEEEFVYESVSSMPASPGSIEGSFTYVPGSKTIHEVDRSLHPDKENGCLA